MLLQVFICGHYPHWLFMSYRGCLRIHPMGIDGNITCFAPFHNVNCPRGFLYFNKTVSFKTYILHFKCIIVQSYNLYKIEGSISDHSFLNKPFGVILTI